MEENKIILERIFKIEYSRLKEISKQTGKVVAESKQTGKLELLEEILNHFDSKKEKIFATFIFSDLFEKIKPLLGLRNFLREFKKA